MADDETPVRRRGGWRRGVPYSPELGEAICGRVAAGELLYTVLREPGMPTPQTIGVWARKDADFGAALSDARRAGGRAQKGGGVWSYTPEVGDEIFERMCEGESLTAIGADPAMPCLSTLFYWRHRLPEFDALVARARRIQAERFCDLGWELAMEATPETAYLTHVRLNQLRWTAGVLAPRMFRTRLVEPEAPPKAQPTVVMRRFQLEKREDGAQRVVGYRPNPKTGKPERDDEGEWVLPRDTPCAPGLEGPPEVARRPLTEEDEPWL